MTREDDRHMNEAHFTEIEKVLLYVSEARERAGKAAKALTRDNADPHLPAALERSEAELRELHRRLMQRTFFAVPGGERASDQERLAV